MSTFWWYCLCHYWREIIFLQMKPKDVTTQMKALDEYVLMELFSCNFFEKNRSPGGGVGLRGSHLIGQFRTTCVVFFGVLILPCWRVQITTVEVHMRSIRVQLHWEKTQNEGKSKFKSPRFLNQRSCSGLASWWSRGFFSYGNEGAVSCERMPRFHIVTWVRLIGRWSIL